MKKVIFLLLLLSSIALCQTADLEIPITVYDNSGLPNSSRTLIIGLDSTATDSINPWLGEFWLYCPWDLPGFDCIPYDHFEAILDLPVESGNYFEVGSYKDIRQGNVPYTGYKEHKLLWLPYNAATAVYISWDFPPGVSGVMQDPLGGILWNYQMPDSGTYTNPAFMNFGTRLLITYDFAGGNQAGPFCRISPDTLLFPVHLTGTIDSLPVTISNTGTENTLIISEISSTNTHFSFQTDTLPVVIPPGANGEFYIRNTSAAGAESGEILLNHNGIGAQGVYVQAPAGLPVGPVFYLTPGSLIFPHHLPGIVDSMEVLLSNPGYLNDLTINNIISDNSYFSISTIQLPLVIGPRDSRFLKVYYTSADTAQSGTITFIHNAPGSPFVLNVSSVTGGGIFYITPSSQYYDPGYANSTTIRNLSTTDKMVISEIYISNLNYGISTPFTLPLTIPPNGGWTFNTTFNGAAGEQRCTIFIFHTAPGSPYLQFVSNQYYEPEVKFRIMIKSGTMTGDLWLGLDSLGSDGFDEVLQERDLPPLPPPGVFDWRFFLPEFNFSGVFSSYKDFRRGFSSYSSTREFRLFYRQNNLNGIEIFWYLPENITGLFTDVINGTFIYVPISDTGSYMVQDPVAFDRLRLIINFNPEVPVELTSFSAKAEGLIVVLKWTTATETNNAGFEIQRRQMNGLDDNWERIGFIQGNGTTSLPVNYTFTDTRVLPGTEYLYRLKQIDLNGEFSYSIEAQCATELPAAFELYQNYPNPFNGTTIIKFTIPAALPVSLKIFDILGREVSSIIKDNYSAGNYSVEFRNDNLSSGVYIYKLTAGTYRAVKKMQLIK